ncbi:MAG: hypothetical protein QM478_00805 [Flavobacteriaceae bacterium]
MSVEIKFLKNGVTATFSGNIEDNEIRDTFIDITEKLYIKNINYILFYFINITSYIPPKNALQNHKTISHFSVSYNKKIKAVIVATHPDIVAIAKKFIKNQANLKWEYFYFDNIEDAQICCE